MTREELNELITGNDFSKVKEQFDTMERVVVFGKEKIKIADIIKEYDPLQHDVMDKGKRLNRFVDSEGEEYLDAITGETKKQITTDEVEVNRLPLPIQQKIVMIAAAFLVGEKIMLESLPEGTDQETLFELVKKVWRDTKLDYKSKEIAKLMKSETHCAELWYDYSSERYWDGTVNEGSKRKPGVQILAESKGDKIRAIFDEYNDLVAFMRGYTVTSGDKEIEHLDIYTEELIIKAVEGENGWEAEPKPNPYKAIPVMYYSQDRPDWFPVRPLIKRKETRFSDFADTNDRFSFPALKASGDVENLPAGDDTGKVYVVKDGGDLSYLTWDSAPESSKMEFDMLNDEIHSGTHTPEISFSSMKGLIGNVSGIALKLLFLDAQMKAADGQEGFGEIIQRRINFLIKMIVSFNPGKLDKASSLVITPKFKPFMPVNDVEYNQLLIEAYEAGMISKKTMVEKSTLVNDAARELEQMEKEAKKRPVENDKNLS